MRQQMPHRHRLRRRTRIQAPLDVDRDAQRPELGQDVRHRLIEGELAVFDEQYRRDAGHRLGHRVDAADAVLDEILLRIESDGAGGEIPTRTGP